MKALLPSLLALVLAVPCGLTLAPEPAQDKPQPKAVGAFGCSRPGAAARQKVYAGRLKAVGARVARNLAASTPPAAYDCMTMGFVPPIRNQGSCGSCYLVSTADGMTCAWIKAGFGKADDSFKISDQFGMDCHNFGGCNGGWGGEVADYAAKNGFPAERYKDAAGNNLSDYGPYEARAGSCRTKQGAKLWKLQSWGYANADQNGDNPPSPAEVKAAILQYGVLNIALDAGGQFGNYTSGVIKTLGRQINHEISLVGWDDAKNAYKVRNQWGPGWGEQGYGWLDYGCYIVDVFWMSAGAVPPPPPVPDGVPEVLGSAVTAQLGAAFSYQISATNRPTSYGAAGLPAGLTCDQAGGRITGTPAATGTFTVTLSAANAQGTGTAQLALTVGTTPPPATGVKSVTVVFPDGATQTLYPPPTTLDELRMLLSVKSPK